MADYKKNVNGIMNSIASRYKKKGKRPYVIPEGGTDPLGIWGYVKAIEEIKKQTTKAKIKIDAICCAVGSGGTYAGLYLGAKLTGWDIDIIGMAVTADSDHFKKRIYDNCIAFEKSLGKNLKIDPEEFIIDDRFIGPGYAKIDKIEIQKVE